MKQIIATIKPFMLDDVIFALHQIHDFPGATISEVKGIGRGFHQSNGKHHSKAFNYPVFARLEVCCSDHQLEEITGTIREKAHTGNPNDGKIVVTTIDDATDITIKKKAE